VNSQSCHCNLSRSKSVNLKNYCWCIIPWYPPKNISKNPNGILIWIPRKLPGPSGCCARSRVFCTWDPGVSAASRARKMAMRWSMSSRFLGKKLGDHGGLMGISGGSNWYPPTPADGKGDRVREEITSSKCRLAGSRKKTGSKKIDSKRRS